MIILYALPNGNTTEHTMGKKKAEGDDWHFDIQHIKAQTRFIRKQLPRKNIVVIYLENDYKSWPQWKTKNSDFIEKTQHIVDTLLGLFTQDSPPKVRGTTHAELYLNGHSGGGRFIFNYLDGVSQIPSYVKNISFLDSNYGYDSTYLLKLKQWIKENKKVYLNVFAYNDSVALLNGKRFVSDTGGTWYRSRLMHRKLSGSFLFKTIADTSFINHSALNGRVRIILKHNPNGLIYHTVQVEKNGFIFSLLSNTRFDRRKYFTYFGNRVYENLIEE